MSTNALARLANAIPIKWGYFTKNGQAKKVIFIGHEKAIYGADGVQLDSKLTSIKDSISDAFSEGKNYVVGNYCIYLNVLYRFTADKPAGAWDGSKVVPVSVSQEIANLNAKTGKQIQYMDAIIPSISIDGTRGDTYYASFALADKDISVPGTPLSVTIIRWNGMPHGGLSYIFDYDFNNMVMMSVKSQSINNVKLRIVYIPD